MAALPVAPMMLPGLLLTLPAPAVAAEELEPASGALELPSWCCWPAPPSSSASMELCEGEGESTGERRAHDGAENYT